MGKNKRNKANTINTNSNTLKAQSIEDASDIRLKKFNLLALLLSFEKYWSPYSLSDGSLYKEEVKEEAQKVVSLFCEIYDTDLFVHSADGEIIKPSKDIDRKVFISSLKSWVSTNELFPNMNQRNYLVNRERSFFQNVLSEFESELSEELGLPIKMKCATSSYEELFHKNVLKWAAQLPDEVVHKIDEACVWATRMNSAGEKGDIILNNIPYQVLSSSLNGNNCNKINSITKGGEHFSAYRLKIKNIHYVSTRKRSQEHRKPRAIS